MKGDLLRLLLAAVLTATGLVALFWPQGKNREH